MTLQISPFTPISILPRSPARLPKVDRRCEIVVCVASARGLTALVTILSSLDQSFPVALVLVPDRFTRFPDSLPFILEEYCPLRVKTAENEERPIPGVIYLPPKNAKLTLSHKRKLMVSPEGSAGTFEASDAIFSSAAESCNGRVVALLLGGIATASTKGLKLLRAAGGLTLAVDDVPPDGFGCVNDCKACLIDYLLPQDAIGPVLENLARERVARHPGGRKSAESVTSICTGQK